VAGASLGRVVSLTNYGAGDVLEIAPARGGETLLLPFTKRIAPSIDFDAGRIMIDLPREVEDEDERR
jgi:16S rRNA processing protein RimM